MSVLRATTISDLAGAGPVTLTGQSAAKAWARTSGSGTPALADSFNVTSVTDNGTGDITLAYTSGFSVSPCSPAVLQTGSFAGMQQILSAATSSVRNKVHDFNGNAADADHHVASFGDLA